LRVPTLARSLSGARGEVRVRLQLIGMRLQAAAHQVA